jgi:hypothetical protein
MKRFVANCEQRRKPDEWRWRSPGSSAPDPANVTDVLGDARGLCLDVATTLICVDEIHKMNLGTRHDAEAPDMLDQSQDGAVDICSSKECLNYGS